MPPALPLQSKNDEARQGNRTSAMNNGMSPQTSISTHAWQPPRQEGDFTGCLRRGKREPCAVEAKQIYNLTFW